MKKLLCAAVLAALPWIPMQARASELGTTVAGGVIGGVAGSVYAFGASTTAASVGSAITGAAAVLPAAAVGAVAIVAATSTPVIVGVAGGGVVAYFLYNLWN